MDPLSIIVGALVAGAAAGATNVAAQAVKDAYTGLKTLIIDRFGKKADLEHAVESMEAKPDSEARKIVLEEELETVGAGKDAEVVQQAQALLDLLQKQGLASSVSYQATQNGNGAIAQGQGAVAAGADGLAIGGDVQDSTVVAGSGKIETLIKDMEVKTAEGDYVERQEITQVFLIHPDAQEEVLKWVQDKQGIDEKVLQNLGPRAVDDGVNRQIEEIEAAQREATAGGVPTSPVAAYQLGMLAASRRDYEAALEYFGQATQADPDYSDAFAAIAWQQQSRATDDILKGDYDAAVRKLALARSASEKTDPLDARALALRGYTAKTLAQVSEARGDQAGRDTYYAEAARMFEGAARIDPDDPSAQNGLGNVQHALSNLDAAIAAYSRAIALAPNYTDAHHDLAIAYEDKMKADPSKATEWCRKALGEWRETYRLAPNYSGFSADYVLKIGQRIRRLERRCG
jgi:tetratricopeptide (TPR) repeat protein